MYTRIFGDDAPRQSWRAGHQNGKKHREIPGLVNIQKAIENGPVYSGFIY